MKKNFTMGLILTFMVLGLAPLAFAVEKSVAPVTASMPTHTTATATPQVTSVEGTVVSIDMLSSTPTLKLTLASGQLSSVQLDRLATTVWKGSQPIGLTQLTAGQKVKVRCKAKNGKQIANSIEIK